MSIKLIAAVVTGAIATLVVTTAPSAAACRKVGPVASVQIDSATTANLSKIGVTRDKLFDAIAQVAETETSGCWGGATGNFDEPGSSQSEHCNGITDSIRCLENCEPFVAAWERTLTPRLRV